MAATILTAEDGFKYEAEGHRYTLNGQSIPGCTSILQGVGLVNLDFIQKEVLERASAIGTQVHDYTTWWEDDELDLADLAPFPNIESRVMGWVEFCNEWQWKSEIKEIPIGIKINGMTFGMIPDRIGSGNFGPKGERVPAVAEIKCTSQFSYAHAIQTAAQALPSKSNGNMVKRYGVRLLEKPIRGKRYELKEFDQANDERIFLAALAIEWDKRNHGITKG